MKYKVVKGVLKKGELCLFENNKVNKDITMEYMINELLHKGWELYGSPTSLVNQWDYRAVFIQTLVKDR
ncbi:MAG: DUF1737 domain-containing protein [Spirochaetota bacterium]